MSPSDPRAAAAIAAAIAAAKANEPPLTEEDIDPAIALRDLLGKPTASRPNTSQSPLKSFIPTVYVFCNEKDGKLFPSKIFFRYAEADNPIMGQFLQIVSDDKYACGEVIQWGWSVDQREGLETITRVVILKFDADAFEIGLRLGFNPMESPHSPSKELADAIAAVYPIKTSKSHS